MDNKITHEFVDEFDELVEELENLYHKFNQMIMDPCITKHQKARAKHYWLGQLANMTINTSVHSPGPSELLNELHDNCRDDCE